ncbi:MAG: molecular chaperone TorD family protein [Nitrospirota bacterium]
MVLERFNDERSEAYRILADLYFRPPEHEILKAITEDFGLSSKETYSEIISDFFYLFPYPGGKLPPLESLFISPAATGHLNPVTEFYVKAGLSIDEGFRIMPDHISLEFLFMSYLVDNNMPGLQKIFLEEHIMNWVPYYCKEVIKQAKTVFYREVGEITQNFIEGEYESFHKTP